MKIEKVLNDFLLKVKLMHSKGTYRHYLCHVNHFIKWSTMMQISEIRELNEQQFVDYIDHMKESCAAITINKRIGILKRCFKTMKIENEFLQSLPKFKETIKSYDMIDESELKRIRRHILTYSDLNNHLYYKCLVLLLIDTGARISEVMAIEKKCVDFEKREILLTHTKTKEDRVVYFQDSSLPTIKKMIAVESNHKYLLHNVLKERPAVYDDTVVIMRRLKDELGLEKCHPHMFRHSLATIWLQKGADIKSVMSVLGHKNLETTERYLHVKKDHIKKQYKLFNLD